MSPESHPDTPATVLQNNPWVFDTPPTRAARTQVQVTKLFLLFGVFKFEIAEWVRKRLAGVKDGFLGILTL